jgi:hypothetical protein
MISSDIRDIKQYETTSAFHPATNRKSKSHLFLDIRILGPAQQSVYQDCCTVRLEQQQITQMEPQSLDTYKELTSII